MLSKDKVSIARLSNAKVSIVRLSLVAGKGRTESISIGEVSFFIFTVFFDRRLKYCSKPIPLEMMKLVALFRLTGMTELSDSVCEM